MKFSTSTLVAGSILLMFAADIVPFSPLRVGLIDDAQAVVGRPLTPVSYAGVARRSAYRGATYATTAAVVTTAAVATTAVVASNAAAADAASQQAAASYSQPAGAPAIGAIVTQLPEGCSAVAINGIEYNDCNGVYYRATFQGNNLVYVVQTP
jgi:hypothetical protein